MSVQPLVPSSKSLSGVTSLLIINHYFRRNVVRESGPQAVQLGSEPGKPGVSMRLVFATILLAFCATSAANASSFVVLDPLESTESPSIIVLGKPESGSFTAVGERDTQHAAIPMPSFERFGGAPAEEPKFVNVSPSVIAMVDAQQPIAMENVASIDDDKPKKRAPQSLPMVIRGGIIGDAFATRSASSPSGPAATEPAAPPQQEVSSAPPSPSNPPAAPEMPPSPSERLPKSALPPPAPPTGRME
jgi:hypothetical protein